MQNHAPYHILNTQQTFPGSILSREQIIGRAPLYFGFSNPENCDNCFHCFGDYMGEPGTRGVMCIRKGCNAIYCSTACWVKHSRYHSLECNRLDELFSISNNLKILPAFVLLVFRILAVASVERTLSNISQSYSKLDPIPRIFSLSLNTSKIRQHRPDFFSMMESLASEMHTKYNNVLKLQISLAEFLHLILCIHTYSIFVEANSEMESLVGNFSAKTNLEVIFEFSAACFTHSCIPNCSISIVSKKSEPEDQKLRNMVQVQSLNNLPPGSQLTICKAPQYIPSEERRSSIIVGSFSLPCSSDLFFCDCSRCRTYDESGNFFSAWRCSFCSEGWIFPGDVQWMGPEMQNSIAKEKRLTPAISFWCINCGVLTGDHLRELSTKVASLKQIYENCLDLDSKKNSIQARNLYSSIIKDFQHMVHPQHYIIHAANLALGQLWLENPGRNVHNALISSQRAFLASRRVLPPCSKDSLTAAMLVLRAGLSLQANTHCAFRQNDNRNLPGLDDPKKSFRWVSMALGWFVLISSRILFGVESAEWSFALRRLRQCAHHFGCCTPPIGWTARVENIEEMSNEFDDIYGKNLTTEVQICCCNFSILPRQIIDATITYGAPTFHRNNKFCFVFGFWEPFWLPLDLV
eukprot:GHVP01012326.1.p1 GENE.GHVP01012326.1~~GHVP01012326.1.p1  ORF type:complete len:741 (-),score=90.54 GHVP01012326.1:1649-3553(-)